MYNLVLFC